MTFTSACGIILNLQVNPSNVPFILILLTFCVTKSKLVGRWTAILRLSLSQHMDPGITCGISVLKISRSKNPPQPPHRPLLSQIPCFSNCPCKHTAAAGANVLAVRLPFGEHHREIQGNISDYTGRWLKDRTSESRHSQKHIKASFSYGR